MKTDLVKTFGFFSELPGGCIHPQGWLRSWAQVNAQGWLLDYARQKHPGVWGKLWMRNPTSAWVFDENNQTLTLCDYTAYFADGALRYAGFFPEGELAGEMQAWVEQLLLSQDPDGYIGAFEPQARWQHWLEIFSQTLVLEALLYRCQVTDEAQLFEACLHAAEAQIQAWGRDINHSIFSSHGTVVVRLMMRLYALTGESKYLRFAREVLAKYGRTEVFLKGGDALYGEHNAVGTEHAGFPALVYEFSGEPELLEASKAAWQMLAEKHLSVAGGPHGVEQMLRTGPRAGCEHCGTVEWIFTSDALARITGEVKYADAAERAFYNAYPAAKSVDGRLVTYTHAPNQLAASEWSNPHDFEPPDWWASRAYYSSAHEPLCCNANGPRAIPIFINAMLKRSSGGLAVAYYGPFQAETELSQAGKVAIRADTEYPFEDDVRLEITPEREAEFPLLLRIPGWSSSARVEVGQEPPVVAEPGRFFEIRRRWKPGDTLRIIFENPIRLVNWKESEFHLRSAGAVVQRGPLTFALPVQEDWQRFKPPAQAPAQDPGKVIAYKVLPAKDASWNYAIHMDRQQPEKSFKLVRLPAPQGALPWECPPLALEVQARRVLNWFMEGDPTHPMTPGMPFLPLELADAEETVRLVPFGFTHLRLAYVPVIEREAGRR